MRAYPFSISTELRVDRGKWVSVRSIQGLPGQSEILSQKDKETEEAEVSKEERKEGTNERTKERRNEGMKE